MDVRAVADDEWDVVAWLWQLFRHDLAPVVGAFPQADGRYNHRELDTFPAPDRCGYLLRAPHPNTREPAPTGFALLTDLDQPRRHLGAFFVVPTARRTGLGTRFALDVVARHPGPWKIGFQHDNVAAGHFWRRVAEQSFGVDWTEELSPVPDHPDVPPDHWIETA